MVLGVIPVQNMEGICSPNFWGGGGKVDLMTPVSKMGGPGGSNLFVQLGAFVYSKIKS